MQSKQERIQVADIRQFMGCITAATRHEFVEDRIKKKAQADLLASA
jgi:hypothetical protein